MAANDKVTAKLRTFRKGQRAAVINCTLGGRYFIEARNALLVRRLGTLSACTWLVDIDGDLVERFMDPAAQVDPDAYVAQMNAQVSPPLANTVSA